MQERGDILDNICCLYLDVIIGFNKKVDLFAMCPVSIFQDSNAFMKNLNEIEKQGNDYVNLNCKVGDKHLK